MKNIVSKLFIIFILIGIMIPALSLDASAAGCEWSTIRQEVEEYYNAYNVDFDFDHMQSEDKYTTNSIANQYGYAITYVTKTGNVYSLLTNTIPADFGLWNTDIVVKEGRVVVTGVDNDDVRAWNRVFSKYKGFIVGCSGLGAITCMLAFVMFFIKMGANSMNPGERSKTLTMLLFTGAGAAGLGAVTLIFGFFWNII